jgi:hypothetical protein
MSKKMTLRACPQLICPKTMNSVTKYVGLGSGAVAARVLAKGERWENPNSGSWDSFWYDRPARDIYLRIRVLTWF